jgi:hypothetical protein
MTPGIGTLNEKPLHEALKRWYTRPGDKLEVPVDGYVIDIVRRGLLVEIQTRSFAAIRRKLEKLLTTHRVRLVYPIAREKWIVRQSADDGDRLSRRRSPKRGQFVHIFDELVSCPRLFMNPGFSLELLLVQEEEVRRHDARSGWRRGGWVTCERRLLEVVGRKVCRSPRDLAAFIPRTLAEPFTTSDLAASIARPRRLAQKMVYCLRSIGCITPVGKRGNAVLYERVREKA